MDRMPTSPAAVVYHYGKATNVMEGASVKRFRVFPLCATGFGSMGECVDEHGDIGLYALNELMGMRVATVPDQAMGATAGATFQDAWTFATGKGSYGH